jgi:hypothetical protein
MVATLRTQARRIMASLIGHAVAATANLDERADKDGGPYYVVRYFIVFQRS